MPDDMAPWYVIKFFIKRVWKREQEPSSTRQPLATYNGEREHSLRNTDDYRETRNIKYANHAKGGFRKKFGCCCHKLSDIF